MTEREQNIDIMQKLANLESSIMDMELSEKDAMAAVLRDARRQLKHFSDLLPYITRGGFVKDKDGAWCKHGDKISVDTNNLFYAKKQTSVEKKADGTIEGTLTWASNAKFFLKTLGNDWIDITEGFKLVQPCQPDACKSFLGEDDGIWC